MDISKNELDVVKAFYKHCAMQMGMYNIGKDTLRIEHPHVQSTLSIVRSFVKKGITLSRLKQLVTFYGRNHPPTTSFSDVVPANEIKSTREEAAEENLIDNSDLLHPILIEPITEVRTLGFGMHNSKSTTIPTVTYKSEYTKAELVDYYCRSMCIEDPSKDECNTIMGALSYLLKTYSLDTVLFAIDDANLNEELLRTPLTLQNKYLPEAQLYINAAKARRAK